MPAKPEKSRLQHRNASTAPRPMPTSWRENEASSMVSEAVHITSAPYAIRHTHATSTGMLTFCRNPPLSELICLFTRLSVS